MLKTLRLNTLFFILFLFSTAALRGQGALQFGSPMLDEGLSSVYTLAQDTSFMVTGNQENHGYIARLDGNLSGTTIWTTSLPNNIWVQNMVRGEAGYAYIAANTGDFNHPKAQIYKINEADGLYTSLYTATDTSFLNAALYSPSTNSSYYVGYKEDTLAGFNNDSLFRYPLFLTYKGGTMTAEAQLTNSLQSQHDVLAETKQHTVWVAGHNGSYVYLWKRGTPDLLWQTAITQAGDTPTFLVTNTSFLYLGVVSDLGTSTKILQFDATSGAFIKDVSYNTRLNAAITLGDTAIICTGTENNRGVVLYLNASTLGIKESKAIGNTAFTTENFGLDLTPIGVVVAGRTEDQTGNSDFFLAHLNPKNVKQQAIGTLYLANQCGGVLKTPLANWVVIGKTLSDNKVHYAFTDSLGRYAMQLDSLVIGVIELQASSQIGFVPCPVVTGNIVGTGLNSQMPDLFLTQQDTLPRLIVDISTPYLRLNDTITYTVRVANSTAKATPNVKIRVDFDPALQAITPLADTLYFGTIKANEIQTQQVKRKLIDNNPEPDKTYCASAQANISNRVWSGPRLVVTGTCAAPDSVRFTIKNIGTGAFLASITRKFQIIQDDIISKQGILANLNPNQSQTISVAKNGRSTNVCIVYQGEDNPYGSYASTRLEACGTGGTYFSKNIYSDYDDDLSYATECLNALPELPTVSKTIVFPLGYGINIPQVSDSITLEYHVVMVNNGTDTAKTVILDITPSKKLKINQIELGASTVPYSTEVTKENHLIFTLSNINLPPVTKDPKRAIGFLNYRIKVPIGPSINNENTIFTTQTTIKFDYGGILVEDSIPRIIKPNGGWTVATVDLLPILSLANVHISPNPFMGSTNITVPETWLGSTFNLYNLKGQLLQQILITDPTFSLSSEGLDAGSYYCNVQREGILLAKGKILVLR